VPDPVTITTEGDVKDSRGHVIEIVVVEITELADVVTNSNLVEEEVVPTTPQALCRTKTTPVTLTQKMQRIKETYYVAIEEDSSVGWIIFGVCAAVVVVIAVALTAPVSIPGIVVVTAGTGGAAATATLTGLGTIAVGAALTGVGAGLTVEFSESGKSSYKRGTLLRTIGPNDLAVGPPTTTFGQSTYSGLHPCEGH